MGQYEVALALLNANRTLQYSELVRRVDVSKWAVSDSLQLLQRKGYIERGENGIALAEDIDCEDDLEPLRPFVIN